MDNTVLLQQTIKNEAQIAPTTPRVPSPLRKRLVSGEIFSIKNIPIFLFVFFVAQALLFLGYLRVFPVALSYFTYLFSLMQLSVSVGNDWVQVLLIVYVVSFLLSLPFLFQKKIYIVLTGVVSFVLLCLAQLVTPILQVQRDYEVRSLMGTSVITLFTEEMPQTLFESYIYLFVLCFGITLLAVLASYFNFLKTRISIITFTVLSVIALGVAAYFLVRLETISQLARFGVIQIEGESGEKCTELKPMLKDSEKWRNFYLQTCSPVWISKDLDFTGPVNALLYTIDFKNIPGSDSTLRIYLDDIQVAKREQSEVVIGENYLVDYFKTLPEGRHTMFILLEPKSYISSEMIVKDVCTAYDPSMSCKEEKCVCGDEK